MKIIFFCVVYSLLVHFVISCNKSKDVMKFINIHNECKEKLIYEKTKLVRNGIAYNQGKIFCTEHKILLHFIDENLNFYSIKYMNFMTGMIAYANKLIENEINTCTVSQKMENKLEGYFLIKSLQTGEFNNNFVTKNDKRKFLPIVCLPKYENYKSVTNDYESKKIILFFTKFLGTTNTIDVSYILQN